MSNHTGKHMLQDPFFGHKITVGAFYGQEKNTVGAFYDQEKNMDTRLQIKAKKRT
jgi:hypothetical protein